MRVLYFAWLRTRMGRGSEEVDPPAHVATVGDLMAWLGEDRPGFAKAAAAPGVIRCAVNQTYAGLDHPVRKDDEVAFFPPVTGG
ncbi:molybdopterin converting factor subunit 1 [Marinivivus vitaminiproducens]|uniref:molybdopterin converting factor subunit 1 n=1 Tax=Marinivivus vitaminiproducens TaxID=3035935 RepID=UPI0027A20B2A|nr:molybdopterin converting factor subunit 1 [Geminicoccaceae bacterium SCSIO 64248]